MSHIDPFMVMVQQSRFLKLFSDHQRFTLYNADSFDCSELARLALELFIWLQRLFWSEPGPETFLKITFHRPVIVGRVMQMEAMLFQPMTSC